MIGRRIFHQAMIYHRGGFQSCRLQWQTHRVLLTRGVSGSRTRVSLRRKWDNQATWKDLMSSFRLMMSYPSNNTIIFTSCSPSRFIKRSYCTAKKDKVLSTTWTASPQLMLEQQRGRIRWIVVGIAVLGVIAFYPELKLGVSRHTAEVASQSLRDENLQIQTQQLASDIIQTVLTNPDVLRQASEFIKQLVAMEKTQVSLVYLTSHILNDPKTLVQITKLSKQLLYNLMQDPATLRQFVDLLKVAINDPTTKKAVIFLLQELMKDPETKENLQNLLAWVFVQKPVQQSVVSTLSISAHDILENADIQEHTKSFVTAVVRDRTVQAQGGDALWSTMMFSLTPSWISWLWHGNDEKATSQASTLNLEPTEVVPGDDALNSSSSNSSSSSNNKTSQNTETFNDLTQQQESFTNTGVASSMQSKQQKR